MEKYEIDLMLKELRNLINLAKDQQTQIIANRTKFITCECCRNDIFYVAYNIMVKDDREYLKCPSCNTRHFLFQIKE